MAYSHPAHIPGYSNRLIVNLSAGVVPPLGIVRWQQRVRLDMEDEFQYQAGHRKSHVYGERRDAALSERHPMCGCKEA
jgi:hypothetical protein